MKRQRSAIAWVVAGVGLMGAAGCGVQDPAAVSEPVEHVRLAEVDAALAALPSAQVAGEDLRQPHAIRGDLGQVPVWPGAGPEEVARAVTPALTRIAPVFRLQSEDLVFRRDSTDAQGHRHVRYEQQLKGIPVIGAELVVHLNPVGRIYAANGTARGGSPDGMRPLVGKDTAVEVALSAAPTSAPGLEGDARLVYLPAEVDGALRLAWEVRVVGEGEAMPVDDLVYVSAIRGSVLDVHPQIHAALNRAVYSANNGSSLPGTLRRSEGGAATGDNHVDRNYAHLKTTYDCYQTVFGRDSYNNAGAQLRSTVHYGSNYVNAFWNGSQMVYGDGNGVDSGPLGEDLDVTVHELTHAVTDYESELIYANESGALNEGMSDIFAAVCESWTRNWAMDADVWKIGEDIWTPNTSGDALRYMANPTQDGSSYDYYPERYTGTGDNGGVHWNSGIANLAFKLLSTGGTHPRSKTTVNVPGVGVEVAGRIFYQANANFLTASTTFAQAKTFTVQAAASLGYDATIQDAVAKAWEAVGVGVTAPPPTTTPLNSGVPVSGLSGASGSERFFSLQVPAGATNLTFTTSGGTGDMDLYVSFGAPPTTSTYDCRPYQSGNNESCAISNPTAGTWYVMLRGYSAYSGVTLTGTTSGGGGGGSVLVNGVPVTNLSGSSGSTNTWTLAVPAGTSSLSFNMSGGTGDADMYVRFGSAPTTTTYDCRPYRSGNSESCTFSNPGAGTWYVMLRGYSAYSGVTQVGS